MKPMIRAVVLSLSLAACAVDSPVDATETVSSSAITDPGGEGPPLASQLAVGPRSCQSFWSCEPNCIFGGGQNVFVQICDGVQTVLSELPCSPDGCF